MPAIRPRYALVLAALGLAAAVLLWPSPVGAQCGTQASSCRNCHEVQAQAPVNTEGAWHIDHAFGDFCEFCHAGNVAAREQDPAHEGMVYPLADVEASCSSCHPADTDTIALEYASALGVDINTAVAQAAPVAEASDPGEETAEQAAPAAEQAAVPESGSAPGGAVIDLNARYQARSPGAPASPPNIGNLILAAMLVGLVGVFGVLIWRFEGLGDKWAELRGAVVSAAPTAQDVSSVPQAVDVPESMHALMPVLEKASPATISALSRLLEDDPQRGGQMIEALARIDPRLVEAVRRLDDQDIELLIVLVRELKERNR